jgi:hypothetical protein
VVGVVLTLAIGRLLRLGTLTALMPARRPAVNRDRGARAHATMSPASGSIGRGNGMERRDPLEIDPETMRQLGYRTVDLLVDRLAGLRAQPVLANADLLALMDEIPELAAEITRTARDRLPGL